MMSFKFNLCQLVEIAVSGESGVVIGRAEYANSCNCYLVRYKASDGRATEAWWNEDCLRA
jgi:hypothetical protein